MPANQFPAAGSAIDFCQQPYTLDARHGLEIASKKDCRYQKCGLYYLYNQEHADSGVVLIWDGKVYCWKNILRDPQHERPGVIAVDTEENVFIAEGGNEYDGAKCWVVFQES